MGREQKAKIRRREARLEAVSKRCDGLLEGLEEAARCVRAYGR
jgi:hypothetical protein